MKPMGSSVTNIRELRQTQIQYAVDLLIKVPPDVMANNIEPFRVNWYETLRTALDSVDIKNLDRILVKIREEQGQMPGMGGMAEELAGLGGIGYGQY